MKSEEKPHRFDPAQVAKWDKELSEQYLSTDADWPDEARLRQRIADEEALVAKKKGEADAAKTKVEPETKERPQP